MRRIIRFIMIYAAAAMALSSCGSATEVGNPTGDIPRTIQGVIDTSTLPDEGMSAKSEAMALLYVSAIPEEGVPIEGPVGEDGSFSLELIVGKTYRLLVMRGAEELGEFSFETDEAGQRGNSIEIMTRGEAIDLGRCRYENGAFVPEKEPRGYPGVRARHGYGKGQ